MKVRILAHTNNIESLHIRVCNVLEKKNYLVDKDGLNKMQFNKMHFYKSDGWEVQLSKYKVMNKGMLLIEMSKENYYLIGDINIKTSFIFHSLLLLMIISLFDIRLNLNLLFIPILFLLLNGMLYLVFFLRVKNFLRVLAKVE